MRTATNTYLVQKNYGGFYQNKFFDFSSFSFFQAQHFEFYVGQFNSLVIYTNFQMNPTYGLYSWAIGQSPKIVSDEFTLFSLD